METLLEAIRRLRNDGYRRDLLPVPGGRLRCGECQTIVEADETVVERTVRFEGISNPDDQAILGALLTPCGHRGLFSSAYGLYASRDEVEVLRALSGR
jgi:hypothetical protein